MNAQAMQMIVDGVQHYCWAANVVGLGLILLTRLIFHSRRAWGILGVLLLGTASANAIAISHAGLNPSQNAASIFGLVILGSLGSRFLGNWLTDGAA